MTLTEVARGSAQAVFDAKEFGDFLIYPQAKMLKPIWNTNNMLNKPQKKRRMLDKSQIYGLFMAYNL